MSNKFICVLGSSPAVVTETLYCLSQNKDDFPTSIDIFTTSKGKQQAQEQGLIHHINQLCLDYALSPIKPSDIVFHVVKDKQGDPMEDIRSSLDQTQMADDLVNILRKIMSVNPPKRIFASIAGGRKSMSFYMGMVFSLFARHQDELTHVLVEPEYEVPGFWYPTPNSEQLKVVKAGEIVQLDVSKAELELAYIPFVRMRGLFGKSTASHLMENGTFEELVFAYQLALDLSSIRLEFNWDTLEVTLNDCLVPIKNIDSLVLYFMIAEDCKYNSPLTYSRLEEQVLFLAFLSKFAEVAGLGAVDYSDLDKEEFEKAIYLLEEAIEDKAFDKQLSSTPKLYKALIRSYSSKDFNLLADRMMTDIKEALHKIAVETTVEQCRISSIVMRIDETGQPIKKRGHKGNWGVLLPPEQIHFTGEN